MDRALKERKLPDWAAPETPPKRSQGRHAPSQRHE
jgi:hypothetical protein